MDRLDRYFGVHGAALTLRSERMQILASNIANAATPGYKARDLDFSAMLSAQGGATPDRAMPSGAIPGGAAGQRLAATHVGHLGGAATDQPQLLYRQPLQPSLDGNSVELATEQLQFAETAVRYRSTLSILGGRIGGLMSALKGE